MTLTHRNSDTGQEWSIEWSTSELDHIRWETDGGKVVGDTVVTEVKPIDQSREEAAEPAEEVQDESNRDSS